MLAFHNYLLQEVLCVFFNLFFQLVKEQVVSKLWAPG